MTTVDRWAFWVLLGIVCLAPLPFAAVLPWAWGTAAMLTAGVLLVWSGAVFFRSAEIPVHPRRIAFPILLFVFTVAWVLIQSSPLTPDAWHHPIWREASAALGKKLAGAISIDPQGSLAALARLLWYGAVFWLALQFCRNREAAQRAVQMLIVFGVAYACYGLIIEFSGAEAVLWFKKTAYRENLTSTFINRNSYAAYAGISLILVTSLLAKRLIDTEIRAPRLVTRLVLVVEQVVTRHWHLAVSWFVVATALFMTDSRAGILAAIVGLVVFLIAMGFSRSTSSRSARIFAVSIIAVSIAVAWVSGGDLRHRLLGGGLRSDHRFAVYELTLDAIGDSPVLGMGYGTYPQVFELYRYDRFEFRRPARKAHNTYLENALELGIPAATLLIIAVLGIVGICVAGTRRRRRDPEYAAAAVAVSVSLGLHSLVDFSLQIPAVTATFAFLLGLGCAQSWSTQPACRFGARQSEQIPGTRSDKAEVPSG